MSGFKITRFKQVEEVEWLKDIRLAIVDKYWIDCTDMEDIDVGYPAIDDNNNSIGEILDIYENFNTDRVFALVYLFEKVDYSYLIDYGIPIENIVFDQFEDTYSNLLV